MSARPFSGVSESRAVTKVGPKGVRARAGSHALRVRARKPVDQRTTGTAIVSFRLLCQRRPLAIRAALGERRRRGRATL